MKMLGLLGTSTLVIFISLLGSFSQACQPGDRSQILLVSVDPDALEEYEVVGAIHTSDGTISTDGPGSYVAGQSGSLITIKTDTGRTMSFDRRHQQQDDTRFCYGFITSQPR